MTVAMTMVIVIVCVCAFAGQLKSRLVCPDCQRVSITFDPYMFLSVLRTEQKDDHTQKKVPNLLVFRVGPVFRSSAGAAAGLRAREAGARVCVTRPGQRTCRAGWCPRSPHGTFHPLVCFVCI